MSDEKRRWPRSIALGVARELCSVLNPLCERLIVAGSLRRGKQEVGDVEMVYIGRTELRPHPCDMFRRVDHDFAEEKIEELLAAGVLAKRVNKIGGVSWGEKNKLAVHVQTGMPVDLFATREASWWNYLVCRTGPAESNTRIAEAAKREGWRWTPYGPGFTCQSTGEVKVMRSEQEVFEFVGLPYLQPNERV